MISRASNYLTLLVLLAFIIAGCCKKVTQPVQKTTSESNPINFAEPTLWKEVDYNTIQITGKQIPLPSEFRTYRLNTTGMRKLLENTISDSLSKVKKSALITMPLPDGKLSTYKISESSTMSPALLAKFPKLRTYGGKSMDDPTATAKLDFMPGGFHGYLITTNGSVIIQPFSEGDTIHYLCYYKHNSSEVKKPFEVPADSLKQNK